MRSTRHRNFWHTYMAILGEAAALAVVGAVVTAILSTASSAATTAAPVNTGEPVVSGTPRVGETLRTTRGSWSGTEPLTFSYRWFRCDGRGAPDASNCDRITGASGVRYVLRQADAGSQLRSQVVARNAEGSGTATSNPTGVIQSARPTNVDRPSISGTVGVGNRLTADRGQWVGEQPITYRFQWLRCNSTGDDCSEIAGANDTGYVVADGDVGRTLRVRVTATNDAGSQSVVSPQTSVVGANQPPSGNAVPVSDLRAAGDRLVVATVQFSPSPVTNRSDAITARVRITARGGRPVSGALVFVRGTPRVVEGQTATTGSDGWVTLTLTPNRLFPEPRGGFNVQFFVKASRPGDPGLGGIAGFRLVQVPLAG